MKKFQHKIPVILKGWGILMCIAMAVVLTSCDTNFFETASDDDSYEARLEKGIMALDDEDYDKAIRIFEGLRDDYSGKQEVCEYLSNAYSGVAGLDTFNFLNTIDELEDNDDTGNIEMVGYVLGDENGFLTQEQVADARGYLWEHAIPTITGCIPDRDDDQKVQLGLVAMFDAALIVAQIVMDDLDETSIQLTDEGLKSLYEEQPVNFDNVISLDAYLTALNQDLLLVLDSVNALAEIAGGIDENELSESFNEFLVELGYGGADDPVTQTDLENYISNL